MACSCWGFFFLPFPEDSRTLHSGLGSREQTLPKDSPTPGFYFQKEGAWGGWGPCWEGWHRQFMLQASKGLLCLQMTGFPFSHHSLHQTRLTLGAGIPCKPCPWCQLRPLQIHLSSGETAQNQVHICRGAEDRATEGTAKNLAHRKHPYLFGMCERVYFCQFNYKKKSAAHQNRTRTLLPPRE